MIQMKLNTNVWRRAVSKGPCKHQREINGFAGSEIEFEDGSKGKFVTEDDVLAILG